MWLRAGSSAQHVVGAVGNCPAPTGAWWWATELWLHIQVPIPTPGPLDPVLIWGLRLILALPAGDLSAQDGPWPPPGWPGSCTVRWRVVVSPAGRAWPCWARPRATSHTASWPVFLPLRDPPLPSPENRCIRHGDVQKPAFRRSLTWV